MCVWMLLFVFDAIRTHDVYMYIMVEVTCRMLVRCMEQIQTVDLYNRTSIQVLRKNSTILQ